ncbi:MAG: serine/threonine-protein kinase [Polyangiaceae bacterium]
MSARDPFQLVGTTIDGKYRIEEVVGVGGSSVVYRAVHEGFGDAEVAVKCLRPPENFSAEGRAAFFGTFRKEGKLLLRLSSEPGIVRVLDLGVTTAPTSARVPFLVLEWLEGSTLADLLSERQRHGLGPFSEREALLLLREIATAVVSAHSLEHAKGRGVAHRDLKPSNVMQTESARGPVWKVLDFGIAKAMQAGDHATAASGTPVNVRVFSPLYGAPEQFHAVYGPTGPWTDVHALGLILIELVTGARAFEGNDFSELFKSAAAKKRPTPRARGARVSDELEELCARAIALKPADRYADAGQLVAAIDAIVQRTSVSAPASSRREPRRRWSGSSLAPWLVALGCVLAVIVLLALRLVS